MGTHMLNLIFILANLLICPHRTCGIVVSRILVRGSINYIKNNIKDTHNRNSNRIRVLRIALVLLLPLPQLSLEAAIIAATILKSIRPTSDLKIIAIVSASLNIVVIITVLMLVMVMMMMTSAMHSTAIECESFFCFQM